MAIPDGTHKIACDAVAAVCTHVAVFTGDAGTTGANQATGGGYARQPTAFPTGGMSGGYWVRQSTDVNVPVAEGDYVQAGYYDHLTAGTFRGSANFVGGTVSVSGTGATITITPIVQA